MSCSSTPDTGYPNDCELLEHLRSRTSETPRYRTLEAPLLEKAAPIRLLLLDVDGVMTDGTLIFDRDGNESKGFNTQDGLGLRLLQECDIDVGVITARQSEAVARRCENLNVRHVYQGARDKLIAYNEILDKTGCKPFEISYMGDDWLDMVLLKRVGLAVAPANAVHEVRSMVHYVTHKPGGHGAVRELCYLILHAKGLLDQLMHSYMNR